MSVNIKSYLRTIKLACLSIGLALIILFAFQNYSAFATLTYDYTWTDQFGTNLLQPHWFWVREDNTHWSLSANPGYMRITTQTGGVYGSSNNQQNILLTKIPPDDFRITTHLTIHPTENFQFAAIQVYQDDDNYVQINRAYTGAQTINFDIELGGTTVSTQIAAPAATLYLRIEKQGIHFIGYYSTDGSTYIKVGEGDAKLTDMQVGLSAGNNGSGVTEIPATFDFFTLEGKFPALNNSSTDNFNSSTLDSSWFWINEDPAFWSLTSNPGFMKIITGPGAHYAKNLLLKSAPFGEFALTTPVQFQPVSNYQIAGLVIYKDNINTMVFGRAYCNSSQPVCVGNGIYFDFTDAGNFEGNFATSVAETDIAYLKLIRQNSMYSAYYSGDGIAWILIGRHDSPVVHPYIGLTASQSFTGNPVSAYFDYFTVDKPFELYLPSTYK